MKTKLTIKALALSIFIIVVATLSSCSVSNQLSSQKPHYHLNLVKANPHSLPSVKKDNENTVSAIEPMPQHGSFTAYQSDEQLNEITSLLKTNMTLLTKEVKKSDPQAYKQLKSINITKILHQSANKNSKASGNNKMSVTNTTAGGGGGGYLGLWLTFLIIAIVFFIFTLVIPILYIFGLISILASAIFFILWIVSLA